MNKAFWKISFSKLITSFFKSDVKSPPQIEEFRNFPNLKLE